MKYICLLFITLFSFNYCSGQELSADVEITSSNNNNPNEVIVKIAVKIEKVEGFIKYVQQLPDGFSAKKIETNGGNFSVTDSLVKIIWLTPPVNNNFVLFYTLTRSSESDKDEEYDFEAYFDFLVGTKRERFTINTISFSFNPEKLATKSRNQEETPKPISARADTSSSSSTNPPVVKTVPSKAKPDKDILVSQSTPPSTIVYCVQIGAFAGNPKITGVDQLHKITMKNGITKYLSGKFTTLSEAEAHKSILVNKGFADAFIVKIKDGKISE